MKAGPVYVATDYLGWTGDRVESLWASDVGSEKLLPIYNI